MESPARVSQRNIEGYKVKFSVTKYLLNVVYLIRCFTSYYLRFSYF